MIRFRTPRARPTSHPNRGRLAATAALGALGIITGACGPPAPDTTTEAPIRTVVEADAYRSAIDSVRSLLRPIAARGVGIALAVHRGDTALWVEGLGYTDDAGRLPVDPDETLFRVYSLSKAMTAVAGARLMEAGRLDPAAPVQRYLPSFPEKDRPVRVMELATHRAGIRHYRDGEARRRTHCATVRDALPIFADDPLVPLDAGAELYSSWGYVLLSAVLEAAADEPFTELMSRLVLDPAGMTETRLDDLTASPSRALPLAETPGGGRRTCGFRGQQLQVGCWRVSGHRVRHGALRRRPLRRHVALVPVGPALSRGRRRLPGPGRRHGRNRFHVEPRPLGHVAHPARQRVR